MLIKDDQVSHLGYVTIAGDKHKAYRTADNSIRVYSTSGILIPKGIVSQSILNTFVITEKVL